MRCIRDRSLQTIPCLLLRRTHLNRVAFLHFLNVLPGFNEADALILSSEHNADLGDAFSISQNVKELPGLDSVFRAERQLQQSAFGFRGNDLSKDVRACCKFLFGSGLWRGAQDVFWVTQRWELTSSTRPIPSPCWIPYALDGTPDVLLRGL